MNEGARRIDPEEVFTAFKGLRKDEALIVVLHYREEDIAALTYVERDLHQIMQSPAPKDAFIAPDEVVTRHW